MFGREVEGHLRAENRNDAKARILSYFKGHFTDHIVFAR